MQRPAPSSARVTLSALTEKQCACLGFLLEGRTSKEIARSLGISHHTVNQRLDTARRTLDARSRREAALIYRNLLLGPAIEMPTWPEDEPTVSEAFVHDPPPVPPASRLDDLGGKAEANGSFLFQDPGGPSRFSVTVERSLVRPMLGMRAPTSALARLFTASLLSVLMSLSALAIAAMLNSVRDILGH